MSVVASHERSGPCRHELVVEVPGPALEAEIDRVVDEYRKAARIPGFRKGKAPRELIAKRYRGEIEDDVTERLVPRYWRQAEAEKQLDVIGSPRVTDVDFGLAGEMRFTVSVETRPEISLDDLSDFQLPDPPTEATEQEIEDQLMQMRRRAGEWVDIDRFVARGDRVVAELIPEGEEGERVGFEVGGEGVWEELSLAVTGLTPGQRASFTRPAEEGGEPIDYEVVVEEAQEIELADLDDELVDEYTELESVDELRSKIAEAIEAEKERERRRRRERALLDQLRQRHPVGLPEGAVNEQTESMVRDYARELARQGVDLETADIDWGELAARMHPEAQKAVHGQLLLDAIAEERDIEVPEERLEESLSRIARAHETTTVAVRRDLDQSGRLGELKRQLRRQEVVERLLDEAAEDEGEPLIVAP